MASLDLMQQFRPLDMSSPGFPDQISNILSGDEYTRRVGELENDDLVSLVDYLDKARYPPVFLCLCLDRHRLSMFSSLPPPLSENVYTNSEAYVAPRCYYRPRTSFCPQFSMSVINLSPREVPVKFTKEPSTAQGFVSNVLGYTPRTGLIKRQECISMPSLPPSSVTDERPPRPSTRRL